MNIVIEHSEIFPGANGEMFAVTGWVGTQEILTTHYFSTEIFENRAAEYDIDPDDFETLLDIVMYEVRALSGLDRDDPTFLHNADSVAIAREALLERIREIKGDGEITGKTGFAAPECRGVDPEHSVILADSADGCPKKFIKDNLLMSGAHLAVKRQFLREERSRKAEDRKVRRKRHNAKQAQKKGQRQERPSARKLRDDLLGTVDFQQPRARPVRPSRRPKVV